MSSGVEKLQKFPGYCVWNYKTETPGSGKTPSTDYLLFLCRYTPMSSFTVFLGCKA